MDTTAGTLRDPTDDAAVLGASANGCPTWHVADGGSDLAGDGTDGSRWRTLHHAMAVLRDSKPSCGTILVHYSPAPYPGRSERIQDPVELETFGDGASATQNLVIRGGLGPEGERPSIVVDSHRRLLTIKNKNWTVENLDIDFNGFGGRGFTVTAEDVVTDGVIASDEIRKT